MENLTYDLTSAIIVFFIALILICLADMIIRAIRPKKITNHVFMKDFDGKQYCTPVTSERIWFYKYVVDTVNKRPLIKILFEYMISCEIPIAEAPKYLNNLGVSKGKDEAAIYKDYRIGLNFLDRIQPTTYAD